jgi:hypothetical protein
VDQIDRAAACKRRLREHKEHAGKHNPKAHALWG